jgi:hypothetical protein
MGRLSYVRKSIDSAAPNAEHFTFAQSFDLSVGLTRPQENRGKDVEGRQ